MRTTRQREAILRTLTDAGRPLSAVEILHLARSIVPGLGLATVYRTVDALARSGQATSVEIPAKPPRYEVAGKGHHHHFLCTRCHRAFEVEGCPGHLEAHVPRGFVLEGHEITLFGRCAGCAALPGEIGDAAKGGVRGTRSAKIGLAPPKRRASRSANRRRRS